MRGAKAVFCMVDKEGFSERWRSTRERVGAGAEGPSQMWERLSWGGLGVRRNIFPDPQQPLAQRCLSLITPTPVIFSYSAYTYCLLSLPLPPFLSFFLLTNHCPSEGVFLTSRDSVFLPVYTYMFLMCVLGKRPLLLLNHLCLMIPGSPALPSLGDREDRVQRVSELSALSLGEKELLNPYLFALWERVTT